MRIHKGFFASFDRDQPAGDFSAWGGAVTFDTDANWHYGLTTTGLINGEHDFLSVALHELGHAVGFGTSDEWNALVSGSTFLGSESFVVNGNSYPTVTGGHWTNSTTSGGQEAAMDPSLTSGTRKVFTPLDNAGLTDMGWEVIELPGLAGDYNDDGVVDAADYSVWRDSVGTGMVIGSYAEWKANYGDTSAGAAASNQLSVPEPATIALCLLACGMPLPWTRR